VLDISLLSYVACNGCSLSPCDPPSSTPAGIRAGRASSGAVTSPVCSMVVFTSGIALAAGQRANESLLRRHVVAMVLPKLSSNVMSPEM